MSYVFTSIVNNKEYKGEKEKEKNAFMCSGHKSIVRNALDSSGY